MCSFPSQNNENPMKALEKASSIFDDISGLPATVLAALPQQPYPLLSQSSGTRSSLGIYGPKQLPVSLRGPFSVYNTILQLYLEYGTMTLIVIPAPTVPHGFGGSRPKVATSCGTSLEEQQHESPQNARPQTHGGDASMPHQHP